MFSVSVFDRYRNQFSHCVRGRRHINSDSYDLNQHMDVIDILKAQVGPDCFSLQSIIDLRSCAFNYYRTEQGESPFEHL